MVTTVRAVDTVAPVHPLDNLTTEQVGDVVTKREIEQASKEEAQVKADRMKLTVCALSLGLHLKSIRDNRYYKILGYDAFETWVESPEIDIDRSTAYRNMMVYEAFVESGAFELEEVKGKSVSKLQMLVPFVTPKAKDWKKQKADLMERLEMPRRELVALLASNGHDRNAKAGFAVDAKYQEVGGRQPDAGKAARGKEADSTFDDVVGKKTNGDGEEVPTVQARKSLGLSGWYELVSTVAPAVGSGTVMAGVYFTTEKVVRQGNRIFVNIE